jgi:hypothetical protein
MVSAQDLLAVVTKKGRSLETFHKGMTVRGGGQMGLVKDYAYVLEAEPGQDFDERFKPVLTPGQMLFMGVFEGKYLNDCWDEFPSEWYLMALGAGTLSPEGPNVAVNYFKVDSRQPLSVWRDNGWAPTTGGKKASKTKKARDMLADPVANPDERGWFQWYCRYWMGRRMPELDKVQIGRWRSFARHAGAVKKGCKPGDLSCRRRERQALLQWSYDPFI